MTSDTGMSDILGQLPILCQKYILGIIVPLSEELLFRSYIFGSITNKRLPLSSLLYFSLLSIQDFPGTYFHTSFFLLLLLGFIQKEIILSKARLSLAQ